MTLPLIEHYLNQHPKVAAQVIEKFDATSQAAMLNKLAVQSMLGFFPHMHPYKAGQLILALDNDIALELLTLFPMAFSRRLLQSIPEQNQQNLLNQLPTRVSHLIKLMIKYPDNSIGSIMNPHVMTVRTNMSLKEVKEQLRDDKFSVPHTLFVLDKDNVPFAYITFKDLILHPEKTLIESICRKVSTILVARKLILSSVQLPDWSEMDSLPIVNSQNIFVGELTHQAMFCATETTENIRPNTTVMVDVINSVSELLQEFTTIERID